MRVEYQMLTRQGRVFVDSDLPHKGAINLKELGLPSVLLSEAGVPGYIEEEHLHRHVQVVTGYAQTRGFGEFAGLGWSVLVRMDRQDILAPIHAVLMESRDRRRGGLDSHAGVVVLGHGTIARRASTGTTGKCLGESR